MQLDQRKVENFKDTQSVAEMGRKIAPNDHHSAKSFHAIADEFGFYSAGELFGRGVFAKNNLKITPNFF